MHSSICHLQDGGLETLYNAFKLGMIYNDPLLWCWLNYLLSLSLSDHQVQNIQIENQFIGDAGIRTIVYLVPYELFAEKILDTRVGLKNQNNIFWLIFLNKISDFYKQY